MHQRYVCRMLTDRNRGNQKIFTKMKSEFEGHLINAVKKQPVLYDRNADGYKCKESIEAAWNEVNKEISKNIKNINVTHCKLRWRTLRDRFVKQIVKTPDGVRHFRPEANRWEYFNRMSFLTDHLQKRKFDEAIVPVTLKRELTENSQRTTDSGTEHTISFSFVEAKNRTDSGQSQIFYDSETQESEYEREVEIDMPQSPNKRIKFNNSEFPMENCEIQEPELVNTDSSDLTINLNRNSLNQLLETTSALLHQQIKQNSRRSPNEAYFQVLDEYFAKLPSDELDKVKVEILNLIILKKKNLAKTHKIKEV